MWSSRACAREQESKCSKNGQLLMTTPKRLRALLMSQPLKCRRPSDSSENISDLSENSDKEVHACICFITAARVDKKHQVRGFLTAVQKCRVKKYLMIASNWGLS
jgi:hypothetical protein